MNHESNVKSTNIRVLCPRILKKIKILENREDITKEESKELTTFVRTLLKEDMKKRKESVKENSFVMKRIIFQARDKETARDLEHLFQEIGGKYE